MHCHSSRVLRPFAALRGLLLIATLAFPAASTAWCQSSVPPPPAATQRGVKTSGPTVRPATSSNDRPGAGYKLGPGDVFKIAVSNYESYGQDNVPVPPDGVINLPIFGGRLQVTGKTVPAVQEELRRRLGRRMISPQVTVTLINWRAPAPLMMSVLGSVKTAGRIEIQPGYRLTEVLSAVGGVDGRVDEIAATLTRAGSAPEVVDLYQAISYPNSKANRHVAGDDVLIVTAIEPGHIAIMGAVAKPGVYELRRAPRAGSNELALQSRLVDAVVAAGGVVAAGHDAATGNAQFKATLARRAGKQELNLNQALEFKDPAVNVPLQNGDYINVEYVPPPPTPTPVPPLNIYITGFVKAPGFMQVAQGAGVMEAVVQAGGLTRLPDDVVVTVKRGDALLPVDVKKAVADSRANLPLQDRDLIAVSEPNYINVRLLGQFAKPEGYHLPPNARLLDAMQVAGGLTLRPDQTQIMVVRQRPNGEQTILRIDPVGLVNYDATQNAILQDGDLVAASPLPQEKVLNIIVGGEVVRQGTVQLRPGMGLAEAIAQAGGVKESASLLRVTVQRNGVTSQVDAYGPVREGKGQDFALEDGDLITVPKNTKQFMVMESVNRPGNFAIGDRERVTVSVALNMAGGRRANTTSNQVFLMREVSPGNAVTIPFTVDQTADPNKGMNVEIRPGDVLYVPSAKPSTPVLTRVLQGLQAASIFKVLGG